uniref:Uncharacterized protein n=1 Tax=Anguilla anguilla TaxID=7936 RepID=A0A0E9QXN1_ANGAN
MKQALTVNSRVHTLVTESVGTYSLDTTS